MMNVKQKSTIVPGISIIVPAKNEAMYIPACIDSLLDQGRQCNYEIIVVDNMSEDDTADIAKQKGVNVITSDAASPAGVRNLGAGKAQFDILAFIDGDCVANRYWLEKAYDCFSKDVRIGVYGGPCVSPDNSNWVVRCWSPSVFLSERVTTKSNLSGGNIIIRRFIFNEIGGFDESLITAEDDNLCNKVRRAGFKVVKDMGNPVVHYGYPDSLYWVFLRAFWHGSTQLRAHGLFGDKVVLLSFLYVLFFITMTVSFAIRFNFIFYTSLLSLFIIPIALSYSRLRHLPLSHIIKMSFFTYTVSFFVIIGRSLGLLREVGKKIKQDIQQ